MSGPTPLPWTIEQRNHEPWSDALIIKSSEGDIAYTTRGFEGDATTGLGAPSWANARLIVLAVNNHAKLMTTLRALLELHDRDGIRLGGIHYNARILLAAIEKEEPK